MRWEEMSWDKVRRAQMRWSVECEECSVKCGAWRVQCEVWSVKCEVWSVKCEVWSVKCEVRSVKCEVWIGKSAVWSEKCEVWSVQCRVWRVQWEVWRAKWSFKCDMWNKTPLSQSARTHGLGWRTAHASSIDEKGFIYIFKATSAPPRAGTTGIILYYILRLHYIILYYICICVYGHIISFCCHNSGVCHLPHLQRSAPSWYCCALARRVLQGVPRGAPGKLRPGAASAKSARLVSPPAMLWWKLWRGINSLIIVVGDIDIQ